MDKSPSYRPTIKSYERLILDDNSEEFNLFINFCNKNEEKENSLIKFVTTINKARVISSKINHIYQIDPTITEYNLLIPTNKKNNNNFEHIEELIKKLFKSLEQDIEINEEEREVFNLICYLLGTENDTKFEISSEEESLSYLTTNIHSKSIEYLSNHFKELIQQEKWRNLSAEIMKEIIDSYIINKNESTNKNKQKEEEEENDNKDDDEIETIFNLMKSREEDSNLSVYFLLKNYKYKYNEDMYKFIFDHLDDDMMNDDLSNIIFVIRKFIADHLMFEKENEQEKSKRKIKKKNNDRQKKRYEVKNIEYENNELSGIFSYLNSKQQENSNLNKFEVKGGGEINSSYPISNLFKYDSNHINNYYYNRNSKWPTSSDSWIEFDFGEQKINLSSYTILSNGGGTNGHAHPKTWTISGSNDCENWKLINRQDNNPSLNGPHKQHRFKCDKQDKYYRYMRYKQEDSWDNDKRFQYAIFLSCIEFFGSILTPKK